jgi:hypothetical protein
LRPEQKAELKRLSDLGINIGLNFDAEEWGVWNVGASRSWSSWGKADIEDSIDELIKEIKQTARKILELD